MKRSHIRITLDDRERDLKAIRKLEDNAGASAKTKDLGQYVSFHAGDTETLLKTGFEYVCQKDSLVFLRKRR
jgi:hypothetical protein